MKRKIISWLLAIACCISLLPSNLVLAVEDTGGISPSTTTVAYFTDLITYPESANYAQVVTATSAAITTEVGGKTKWDNGLIIIEPENGYDFVEAYLLSDKSQTFKTSTVKTIVNNWGRAVNIPEKISSSISGKDSCTAIEIDTNLYNQIRYGTISLDFKNNTTGKTVSQKFKINSNQINVNMQDKEINTNTVFDLFGDEILGEKIQRSDWQRADFEIAEMRRVGSGSYNIPEGFLEREKVKGNYRALKASVYHFNVTDKKTGIMYVVFINVVLDENAPLKKGSITVLTNNAIINDDNWKQATFNVNPSNKDEFVVKNVDFSFALPEGAIIDWSSVQVQESGSIYPLELEVNKEKIFSNNVWTGIEGDYEEAKITFLATEQNGQSKLSITSDCGLRLNVSFNIRYMEKDYYYSIALVQNSYLGVNSGTYYLHPAINDSDTEDIFNYLWVNDNAGKQRFINNVNNGIYKLTIPGVEKEDLIPFDGNVLFKHPGYARLNIYDTQLKVRVASESMRIIMRNNTITKYTNSCNLKSLINGYWESSYKVDCPQGIEYYLDNNQNPCIKKIETEDVTGGTVIVRDNSGVAAEFGITFSSEEDFLKNIEISISEMSSEGGESFVVDMTDDEKAVLTAAILKALKESCTTGDGNGNCLVVTLESSSGNRVEWSFNSAVMGEIADKDIGLNVNVGDDVKNEAFDRTIEENNVKGLKVGFCDNGKLPGEVQVRLYLSDEEAEMLGGSSDINLYYFNSNTLVKEKSSLCINTDPVKNKKYISIPITHNSEFILSATDLDKNTSSSSGIILGGGTSIVYTPAPTATVAPTATPTATSTPTVAPTTTPAPTATVVPTAAPTITPEQTAVPTIAPTPEPTVTPSVKNKVKKVKAVKKKVTIQKNKKVNVNFKVTTTNNKKVVKDKVKVTVKNKKVARVMKTKVKVGKTIVTVKGLKKGKTILKVNIGGKTAKTTLKIQ